jgi:hypothetical protein
MIAAGIQPILNERRTHPSAAGEPVDEPADEPAGDAVDASGVEGVVMSFPVDCIG